MLYTGELSALKDEVNKRAKAEQLEALTRRVKAFEEVAARDEQKAMIAGGDIESVNEKYI